MFRKATIFLCAGALLIGFVWLSKGSESVPVLRKQEAAQKEDMVFSLASPKFVNNGFLMPVYTCDGDGISPPFEIKDAPSGVKSFVLISDDPDAPAGTWVHWLVFNIPPETRVIGEGEEPKGTAGRNSWGKEGYGGPCPPSGTHRYFFKLYALDVILPLAAGSGKNEIERAMAGHILGQAKVIGLYARK